VNPSQEHAAYRKAGVDIDRMMTALDKARPRIRRTHTPGVVGEPGGFGGLFRSPGRDALLVSSIDGVGTKLAVANRAGRHDTVGRDLVHHCVNDILTQGARPLFFLDYLGTSRLKPRVLSEVIGGLARACRQHGCALIGGETAELPGVYREDEYDLVGAMVGVVSRRRHISGMSIRPGDAAIGLRSGGLHTNGYTLARNLVFEEAGLGIHDRFPGTRRTVAEVLLTVHRSYWKPIRKLVSSVPVRGLAHITGGGLVDNVPRVLPQGLCARIDRETWTPGIVFRFLQETGGLTDEEMYRVFNMGIGMVLFVRPRDVERTIGMLRRSGERPVRMGHVGQGHPPLQWLSETRESHRRSGKSE